MSSCRVDTVAQRGHRGRHEVGSATYRAQRRWHVAWRVRRQQHRWKNKRTSVRCKWKSKSGIKSAPRLTMRQVYRSHSRHRTDVIRTGSHWRYYHASARQQKITGKHNKEPGRSVRTAAHCDAMTLTQSKPRSECLLNHKQQNAAAPATEDGIDTHPTSSPSTHTAPAREVQEPSRRSAGV